MTMETFRNKYYHKCIISIEKVRLKNHSDSFCAQNLNSFQHSGIEKNLDRSKKVYILEVSNDCFILQK